MLLAKYDNFMPIDYRVINPLIRKKVINRLKILITTFFLLYVFLKVSRYAERILFIS
jgi:hypothetical protein